MLHLILHFELTLLQRRTRKGFQDLLRRAFATGKCSMNGSLLPFAVGGFTGKKQGV